MLFSRFSRVIGSLLVVASCTLGLLTPAAATTAPNKPDIRASRVTAMSNSVVNAGWLSFEWYGRDANRIFTFTTRRAVRLSITDAYCRGDAFVVRDKGKIVLRTVTVAEDGCDVFEVDDPDVAYRDPTYSHGSAILRPGTHKIRIEAYANPYGAGAAYIRFDFPPRPLR